MFKLIVEAETLEELDREVEKHATQLRHCIHSETPVIIPAGTNDEVPTLTASQTGLTDKKDAKKPRRSRASRTAKKLPAATTEVTLEIPMADLMAAVGAFAQAKDDNPDIVRKFLSDSAVTKLSELDANLRSTLMEIVSK